MIYLIIGRRVQGKTTLGYYITQRATTRVVFDPRALVRPAHAALVERTADIDAAIAELRAPDRRFAEVVVRPASLLSGFERLTRQLDRWRADDPAASFTILVDEFRFLKSAPPERMEAFDRLLRMSDPARVHIVLTCHRPLDVPTDIRSIADHWLLFRITQEHDLRVIAERSYRASLHVQRLDPRHYVHWDDQRDEAADNPRTHRRPDLWHLCLHCGHRPLAPPDDACLCACHPGRPRLVRPAVADPLEGLPGTLDPQADLPLTPAGDD